MPIHFHYCTRNLRANSPKIVLGSHREILGHRRNETIPPHCRRLGKIAPNLGFPCSLTLFQSRMTFYHWQRFVLFVAAFLLHQPTISYGIRLSTMKPTNTAFDGETFRANSWRTRNRTGYASMLFLLCTSIWMSYHTFHRYFLSQDIFQSGPLIGGQLLSFLLETSRH